MGTQHVNVYYAESSYHTTCQGSQTEYPRRFGAKAIIARAAKQNGDTLSEFVLENAYGMASELLVDEGVVSLSKKQIAHIFEILDHPPAKSAAAVRKLLTERSILEG